MTNSEALTAIAICMIILTAVFFISAAALIYFIASFKGMVRSKIDEAIARIDPVAEQARSIAEQARQTAENVAARIDAMAARAEETVNKVGDNVQSISNKVEEAINPQIVTAAGIVGTAARCVQIYRDFVQLRRGDGEHREPPAADEC